MVLYPMFVHMYLELVYKGSEKEGKTSNYSSHTFYTIIRWGFCDIQNTNQDQGNKAVL